MGGGAQGHPWQHSEFKANLDKIRNTPPPFQQKKKAPDLVTHTLIPALGRQKQKDLCKFKASLIYIVSSQPAGLYNETPSQKKEKDKKRERQVSKTVNRVKALPLYMSDNLSSISGSHRALLPEGSFPEATSLTSWLRPTEYYASAPMA